MRDFVAPQAIKALLAALALALPAYGQEPAQDSPQGRFELSAQPVLEDRCHACHGNGIKKGNVDLSALAEEPAAPAHRELWLRVLKNVRAGIMPPADQPRLDAQELSGLESWIKRDAFGIDPNQIDPGRAALRRLNRVEYANTIRDLMGVEFRADEEFPPDDTGYGFDTIADVLTVSPLLLEKYLEASKTIVECAVPRVARAVDRREINRRALRDTRNERSDGELSFYVDESLGTTIDTPISGDYQLAVNLAVRGGFDFDPGRCQVVLRLDGDVLSRAEYAWASFKKHPIEVTRRLEPGAHRLELTLTPLMPIEEKRHECDLLVESIALSGPLAPEHWVRPKNYDRFFHEGDAPGDPEGRRRYAARIIDRFGTRAFRRPLDLATRERLVSIAEARWSQPGETFESGIAQSIVALLASPRFLFRAETTLPANPGDAFPLIDEWSLASRLSYLLWSTLPDEESFALAQQGALRNNLKSQVARMLADERANAFVENFVGQWLQTRDIEGVSINGGAILRRDRVRGQRFDFDRDLRLAMKRETEMLFAHVMRQDRSVLELIDGRYTFLNERLAKHYGIGGVEGERMRKIELPDDSPRGGVLTHGAFLAVTSNPTRTSPVKRGLFVLDNILGTPAPPPPADVPLLEDSEKAIEGHDPTLREALELHRSKPLCASCHARMDPIGLALENFNALGMWREKDRDSPIDASGKLLTGESFMGIGELKRLLATNHKLDFERCLAEKLLTYALGRGLDYQDTETIDQIVARLTQNEDRFSALLLGVIESPPFQRRRPSEPPSSSTPATSPSSRSD